MKHSFVRDESESTSSPKTDGDQNIPNESIEAEVVTEDVDKSNISGDWSEESFNSEVNKTEESDWSKKKSHSIGGEMEKDDWSDWDDAEIESQISQEIERELETMEMTEEITKDEKKNVDLKQKRTIASGLDKNPVHSKRGALKLEKKAKPSKSVNETVNSQKDNVEVAQAAKVANFLPTKKQSSRKTAKEKPTTVNPNTDLGAEFDVKSVTIMVDPLKKNDPFDFFADMAPTISYTKPISDLNSAEVEGSNSQIKKEKSDDTKSKVDGAKFDVILTTHEEVRLKVTVDKADKNINDQE